MHKDTEHRIILSFRNTWWCNTDCIANISECVTCSLSGGSPAVLRGLRACPNSPCSGHSIVFYAACLTTEILIADNTCFTFLNHISLLLPLESLNNANSTYPSVQTHSKHVTDMHYLTVWWFYILNFKITPLFYIYTHNNIPKQWSLELCIYFLELGMKSKNIITNHYTIFINYAEIF
jgi:hypothetical protein